MTSRRVVGASPCHALLAILGLAALAGLAGCGSHQAVEESRWPEVELTPQDRVLILAPHPDDEVPGCGGIIQRAVAMGLPVRVVFFTYGDNNQWSFLVYRKHPVLKPEAVRQMGLVRHDEAMTADQLLGLSPDHLTFLGYPDFGTLRIWETHWGNRPPFESMLTKVTQVPYANALRPGASYKGEDVVRDLTTILREFRPTKLLVSHPGDHMPDHLALYLFTRVALWDLEGELRPDIFPYLVHYKRWPKPRGDQPTKPLEPPSLFTEQIPWRQYRLSPVAIERKRAALKAHRTQYNSSARYLLSFVRPNELFGDFPIITLRPAASAASLSPDEKVHLMEAPEELTDVEQASFVGLEWRSVQLDDGKLVLSIAFSRPLAETVSASMFIFGYRRDQPFAQMPKLHIKVGAIGYSLYDQDRTLSPGALEVTRQPNAITIRVPLQILGDPTRILTSARTYLGDVPLDWVSWRIVELSPDR